MTTSSQYDFIICGAGCAGLSLAMHMIHSGAFSEKKILLIDKDAKQSNDRTWCFWQKEESLFESLVYKQWKKLWFYGDDFSTELSIEPYQYKMIRGIDFYDHCFNTIKSYGNIDIVFEKVDKMFSDEQTGVMINGRKISADYIFNSVLFEKPQLNGKQCWLLQHFKGWVIETEYDAFNEGAASLIDFRPEQNYGTTFCYVLPFSSRRALVEYTLFSPEVLPQDEYDKGLAFYIGDTLKISGYKVVEEEFGVIPMTNYSFPSSQNNIVNIGTAGGQTKGSSGYTFNFIQKHSKAIVNSLMTTGKPFIKREPKRFLFYDSVLLKVLKDGTPTGKEIFSALFKKNPAAKVFKFLDNETSPAEEMKIIASLPTLPFLKAGISQMI